MTVVSDSDTKTTGQATSHPFGWSVGRLAGRHADRHGVSGTALIANSHFIQNVFLILLVVVVIIIIMNIILFVIISVVEVVAAAATAVTIFIMITIVIDILSSANSANSLRTADKFVKEIFE